MCKMTCIAHAKTTDSKTAFWLDSQTVLTWIKTLPWNHLSHLIQETLDPQAFKFIRSDVNPADVLTRGVSPEEIKSWTKGPRLYDGPKKSGLSSKKARNKSNKDRTTVCEEPTSCAVC